MIATYYAILWDVLIGLAFAVGFKVVGGYVMKMMLGWFREDSKEASTEAGVHDAAQKSARDERLTRSYERLWNWLCLGLSIVWVASGLLQIRPLVVTTSVSAILRVTNGLSPASMSEQMVAHWWANHAIVANIVSVLGQLGLGLTLWLSRRHWLGRVMLGLSVLLALCIWLLGGEAQCLVLGEGSLLTGPLQSGLWVAILSALLLLPSRVWKHKDVPHSVQIGRSVTWLLIGLSQIWYTVHSYGFFTFVASKPIFPVIFSDAVTVIFLAAAVFEWVMPAQRQLAVFVGFVLALIWWLSEGFGLHGGYALLIGSAPPLALMALLIDGRHVTNQPALQVVSKRDVHP